MTVTNLFPLLLMLFLAVFILCLPDLRFCALSAEPGGRKTDRRDILTIAAVTAAYAATAFFRLGDMKAPQSFVEFTAGDTAVIELSTAASPDELIFYSGINTGVLEFSLSEDGESFVPAAVHEQDHAAVLKWHSISIENTGKVRFIRVEGRSGAPRLGEIAVRSEGELLPVSSDTAFLCDEQDIVPARPDYMNSSYFDEIYHARTAQENIEGIYPYEISHPPLGKLLIAAGISLFGLTPFGWRFTGTLLGVLMLPAMYIFVKKLFGGRYAPACASIVFAFDFMHYVQTRIATIDTYAVFFIILMYLFMYMYVQVALRGESRETLYLFLSGLFFGLGAASKWTCIYAGAGLAVIWAASWIMRRKSTCFASFLRCCGLCVVFFMLIPAAIYYVSYYPYGASRGLSGAGMFFTREYFSLVVNNQQSMFSYHSAVTAAHPFSSRWYQWVLDIRPILYYAGYDGAMRSSFGAWVNPVLCWGGLLALFAVSYIGAARHDARAAFILTGYFAQLVPWMFITRTTYEYHYFPCTVFLTLALAFLFSVLEQSGREGKRLTVGFTCVSTAVFAVFYPALSGMTVNSAAASALLKWLPTWPF